MAQLTKKQINNINKRLKLSDDQSIVLIDVMEEKEISQEECNRNVYCIDKLSQIVWQIEFKPTGFDEDPYVHIDFIDGNLIAKNYSGFKYKVALSSGCIDKVGWDK